MGGLVDNPSLSFVIWILVGCLFLICPFVASRGRRRLCAARIRERRWNVNISLRSDSYHRAVERYERARAAEAGRRSPLSSAEEEEIRQLFLVKHLSKYTKTIESDDIHQRKTNDAKDLVDTESSDESDSSNQEDDIESGQSTDDSDESDEDLIVEYSIAQQADSLVSVPAPGENVLQEECKMRQVANGCAICLCEFETSDDLTWAANEKCSHVFHADCILNWMLALGRKEQKRRRAHPERSTGDPIQDAITFHMLCPCCRQEFVEKPSEESTCESDSTPNESDAVMNESVTATNEDDTA